MIILGSLNSNKTALLIERYVQLINSGVNPENILFLTLNAYKKERVIKTIKSYCFNINPNIQTFLGLCYNSVLKNKEILEEKMPLSDKKDFTMCGLEVSQNLFLEAVREVGFKDYNSKINLVHQLLRRHSLIVSNNLSESEVDEKSRILNEAFALEAKKTLDLFKVKTLEMRAFDYLRQQSLFRWLYENTDCCKNIKYIFIDDYDEQTPACNDFFKFIKSNLKDYFIGLDPDGSSRMGYLCADLSCTSVLDNETKIIQANELKNSISYEFFNYSKRIEMISSTIKKIKTLVENGVELGDISVVTPVFDNQLKFVLKNSFENSRIKYQMISGSEKLSDDNFIRSVINLLKLINVTEKELFTNIDILNSVFPTLLEIPQKYASIVIKKFQEQKGFVKYDFKDEKLNKKYEKFLSISSVITAQEQLSEQLNKIYNEIIIERENTENEMSNFIFLSKQIKDLEMTSINIDKDKILKQISNSIIAENDMQGQKIERNALIIGTPQKIIDLEVKTKYQFWLDISSDEWTKQDTGTIYNAWVFSKSWKKDRFTYEDNLNSIEEKTKRVLRKLKLLAHEKIFAMSSSYNSVGIENTTGISAYLKTLQVLKENQIVSDFKFKPRKDQEGVFEYKDGCMALSAVPGAGKTTVLQALILKLISDGTSPENIFVLTYMESAAKTLKDRLLNNLKQNGENVSPDVLPNISTIHGLALRIIKENGNYTKVNLTDNFEICDEILRQKLINETIGELRLNYEDYEKYDRSLSVIKFVNINSSPKTKELKQFLNFYNVYQSKLANKNLIDYDDMLILAVKLLEENPQILGYYQKLCKYVLEDEAQDSSEIQQRLIKLLAGKKGNIIRCGDINQAITSTFTNADTKGFLQFIKNNYSVEMNCSQRCAKGIYELANNLIDFSKGLNSFSNGAFYDIKMQPVEGKNPVSADPIKAKIFEVEEDETNDVINEIKNLFQVSPNSSIAILVRNNYQVLKYNKILKENGIPVISRTDCLAQNKNFNIILSLLKFCVYPWKNNLVQDVYKNLFNIKEDNLFLEQLEEPFINIDVGRFEDENLIALHWELNYWLSQNNVSLEQLALKIGDYYCENEIDASNLYIIAELIRRFSQNSNSYTEIVLKLEQISTRPIIAGLKLFSEEDSSLQTILGGTVQVMTMHKSKGDEFDYVFIPEFSEKNLATNLKFIKTGTYVSFFEELKGLDKDYVKKSVDIIKKEILHENLRLLYVAITRAKKRLYFSVAEKQYVFGRLRNVEKSELFDNILLPYLSN